MRNVIARVGAVVGSILCAAATGSCAATVDHGDGLCSLLGPCIPNPTYPDYHYTITGVPASDVDDLVGVVTVGDTVSLYFVRHPPFAPCGGAVDTIRTDGAWTTTQPLGGPMDSSIATIAVTDFRVRP
jgi:hypothetical protein